MAALATPARRDGPACGARRRRRPASAALLALACGGGALPAALAILPAWAQTADHEAVMSRARPDFDAIGIEIFFEEEQPGPPIIVFPTLELRSGYDNNVFREKEDGEADLFWEISPELVFSNADQELGLEVGLSATVRRNLEFESNDFEDYDAYGQASYFFMEDSDVTVQVGYSRGHEDRSDPDSTGPGENIVQFDRYRALLYSRNRLSDFLVNPTLQYYYYDYKAGADEDGRDHWEGEASVRLGYEFSPGYVVFVEPAYNLRRYTLPTDELGFDRNSSGWRALAGVSYNVSAVTSAEAHVGYFGQNYEDPALPDASGLTYGVAMTWNPLDVLTVNLSIDRSVQESTLADVSSTVSTVYKAGFDYELRDNLILTSSGGVSTSSFQGSTRDDLSYNAGGGVVYLVNEFARARLGARYEARASNNDSNNYSAMVVEAVLALQY